jgi:uncharacterized protein (TIGR03083 family)
MTATTATDVATVPPITRDEATALAATAHDRYVELLAALDADDWARPTDCAAWDVRAMATHVLGSCEASASIRENVRQMRAGLRAARRGGSLIDGLSGAQVSARSGLTPVAIVERLRAIGPRAVRGRRRTPAPMRAVRIKGEGPFAGERFRLGWIVDVVLTRDTWMHRVDTARATGRSLVLTADHDGRLVADIVAEWARRHGRPFSLTLTGPAGGSWSSGAGGPEIELDAVEFCRIVSGRAPGEGLLATEVLF